MHRTGGITVLSTFSVSQNQKISRGNSLVFQKRSDMEKQLWTRREGRGILRSSVGLCFDSRCRKVPKNIKGEPLSLFRKSFRNDKIHAKEGASASRFYRFFFVSKNRKISQGKSLVFQKYSEMEKIMDRKGGVVSRGSVRIFLSHSTEKISRVVRVPELFWYGKSYGQEGGYHVFPSKIFGLTVPKKFIGEPSCVLKDSSDELFHAKEEKASRISRKFFVS